MKYIIDQHSLDAAMVAFLLGAALWLKFAPTRSQMWRWLEFQAAVNAEANELKERRRQGRRERMAIEETR